MLKVLYVFLSVLFLLNSEKLMAVSSNDTYVDAEMIAGEYSLGSGDLTGATREQAEPAYGTGVSVWYKWVATDDGSVEFGVRFAKENRDRSVIIFMGSSIDQLTMVATSHLGLSFANQRNQRTSAIVAKGVTYYIRVSNDMAGVEGDGGFGWFIDFDGGINGRRNIQSVSYQNDLFADAKVIEGIDATVLGYSSSATRELAEPMVTGARTLWWKWTAPTSGIALFSTLGAEQWTSSDAVLTVGSGTAIFDLESVTLNDSFDPYPGITHQRRVEAGKTYYIGVGGGGAYLLSLIHHPDTGGSSGSGVGGRYSTTTTNLIDNSVISGLFTITGATSLKAVLPSGFLSSDLIYSKTTKAWSFKLKKRSPSIGPVSALVVVYGYKNGVQVAKVSKIFRVW